LEFCFAEIGFSALQEGFSTQSALHPKGLRSRSKN
jgi:hypothetical protein